MAGVRRGDGIHPYGCGMPSKHSVEQKELLLGRVAWFAGQHGISPAEVELLRRRIVADAREEDVPDAELRVTGTALGAEEVAPLRLIEALRDRIGESA